MKYYPGMVERIGFDFYADIAERVVLARNEKGLAQKELAGILKWKAGKLARLESVKIRIELTDLEELSKALGVTVNWLLEAHNDSPIGNCRYLVWFERCKDLQLYVDAPNARVGVLELVRKLKKSGVRPWDDARERAYVKRVGIPVGNKELKDRLGSGSTPNAQEEEPIEKDDN